MSTVVIGHASLQRSDPVRQRRRDITEAFSSGYDMLGGTEALQPGTRELLEFAAVQFGYWLSIAADVWVAMSKDYVPEKPKRNWILVIPGVGGRYASRGIVWMKGKSRDGDTVTYGVSHHQLRRFRWQNKRLTRKQGRWGRRHGKGYNLVWHSADWNENDEVRDVYHGQPFLTCWDEIDKHPPTHGRGRTIDGVAQWRWQNRVTCTGAWTDPTVTSDHRRVWARYRIKPR